MGSKIDAHMHLTQWFTADGETRCFDALADYYKTCGFDGADVMCCSNNSDLWARYEPDQCIIAAIAKHELPETYIHGCMLLPSMVKDGDVPSAFDFKYQLDMLSSMGFDGIKCCEFKPDSFKINRLSECFEDFEEYFSHCEMRDIPMCWHVADPEEFWDINKAPAFAVKRGNFYGDGTFPKYDELYKITYGILDRHPKLRVMLAHAFFLSEHPERMTAVLDKYPNVTIDLAPGWEMFTGYYNHYNEWHGIFRKYSDRFMFATDTDMHFGAEHGGELAEYELRYLSTDDEYVTLGNRTTRGIALCGEELENILSGNCRRMLGDSPKPLDTAVFKEYCKTFLPYIPETQNKHEIEKYLKKNF